MLSNIYVKCVQRERVKVQISIMMNDEFKITNIFRKMFRVSRPKIWVERVQVITLRQSSSNKKHYVNSEVFKQQRLDKLRSIEMYPYRFEYNSDISTFRDKYENIQPSETLQEEIKLTGMIANFRDYGKKMKFLDIERNGKSLQLKISKENFNGEINFSKISELFSKGDKVGKKAFYIILA